MKALRTFSIPWVVIALALVASPAASGQEGSATVDAQQDRFSTFRGDFNKFLDHYDGVFRKLAHARGLRLTAEARERLRAVSDDQLAKLFERVRVPDLSALVEASANLESLTPTRSSWASRAPESPGFPGAPRILGACDVIPHSSSFTLGALAAFQIARTALAALEFVCLEVIVVLGEGGNGSLACVPLAVAQDLVAIPFELADFCGGEEDSALAQGSYDRLEHIHTDLEDVKADILASIDANTQLIIINDNANRELIINNDNANRDTLITEIRNLSCDIERLLHTPEGLRASSIAACQGQPKFPYNFPEKP